MSMLIIDLFASCSIFNQVIISVFLSVLTIVLINVFNQLLPKPKATPPVVFHLFPIIGSSVSYGLDPYAFLETCRKKYGNVFTFILINKKVTVALGPAGNSLVLNGNLSEVNAEEAYTPLTTPVFGSDVVYDCPNHILIQQKKFIKSGLNTENFQKYVPLIVEETLHHLEDHVFKYPENEQAVQDIFQTASDITICTASATLQGPEVREGLNKSFAHLFHDLDEGFTPINFVFPNLPLPSYRRRDRAQVAMRNFYLNIIQKRREDGREGQLGDVIDCLQGRTYKDGRPLTDKAIAHLMIALLMAGQHTSAATCSWLLLHLASRPDIVDELRKEQIQLFGHPGQTDLHDPLEPLAPLDCERVQSPLMTACIKEVLRLHPPIRAILRKVKSPIVVPRTLASKDESTPYVIPTSHFVLAAPGVSQIDPSIWESADEFQPQRWLKANVTKSEEAMVDYGFGAISSGANSPYLPFGAGRHRCIGEQFAHLQLATIAATIIRNCDLELTDVVFPKPNYTTILVCPKQPRNVRFIRTRSS